LSRPSAGALVALLCGSFVSQLPYAVSQPLLPLLLGRTGADVDTNTGLLTAAYAGALFLFAPLWGSLSDRWPRRTVFLAGLSGLTVALLALSFVEKLSMLYLGLFLGGAFSAAIWPVALAMVTDLDGDRRVRARHFGWIYVSVTAGLLTGPAIGGVLGRGWATGTPVTGAIFLVIAAASAAALTLALLFLPVGKAVQSGPAGPAPNRRPILYLLALSLLASWGLGTFEVGLTLRARADFAFGPDRIGWMFVECMIVMVLTQALIFNRRLDPDYTRWLLVPAAGLLGLGLLWLGSASTAAGLVISVGVVAAALGALSPVIGYWISLASGEQPGGGLGRQTAVASLGQALGAGVTGLLLSRSLDGAAFMLAGLLTLAGALAALALSSRLSTIAAR